ncbi:MAG: dTMP kinase [Acidimicrobiales bacterium]
MTGPSLARASLESSAPGSEREAVGRFVVLEGGEGCGKSTQARILADRLGAVLTREPGGTALGETIRAAMLAPAGTTSPEGEAERVDDRAEALMMMAARAQHVARVIGPALAAGRHVVSDRYTASTVAYQGFGRGLEVAWLEAVSRWAAGGVDPDLVILLEVPATVADQRAGPHPDRIEAAGREFHSRVAHGYRALAAADPGRWRVVDGDASIAEVASRVWQAWTTLDPR